MDRHGLDIRPHRARMNARGPRRAVQGPDDPLRLVFVCAMWMTGFDAPSVLDDLPRPADAEPHADADDRPRQPGVPRQGQRADRRLHRRVPEPRDRRSPSTALPTPTPASTPRSRTRPSCVAALDEAVDAVVELCAGHGVDLAELRAATGFAYIALRDAAVEALLVDEETRTDVPGRRPPGPQAVQGRAARPGRGRPPAHGGRDPGARRADRRRRPGQPRPTLGEIADAVDALLDRSVGAEEYVIRAAAEGIEPDPLDRPVADRLRRTRRPLRWPQARRDRPPRRPVAAAVGRRRPPQPDPLRPRRADRGADRRVQRRQPQHRRVPAAAHRAVHDLTAEEQRAVAEGHERGGAGDLRSPHQARAGPRRRRAGAGEGQRQAAARPPARQARPRLAPQGGHDGRRPHDHPR